MGDIHLGNFKMPENVLIALVAVSGAVTVWRGFDEGWKFAGLMFILCGVWSFFSWVKEEDRRQHPN